MKIIMDLQFLTELPSNFYSQLSARKMLVMTVSDFKYIFLQIFISPQLIFAFKMVTLYTFMYSKLCPSHLSIASSHQIFIWCHYDIFIYFLDASIMISVSIIDNFMEHLRNTVSNNTDIRYAIPGP